MSWWMVFVALSLTMGRESTIVVLDTLQVWGGGVAGNRVGIPYAGILNTGGGDFRIIRTGTDTLLELLPPGGVVHPEGHYFRLIPSGDTLLAEGLDPSGVSYQDTVFLPSGWTLGSVWFRSCALPGSSLPHFCSVVTLYDGSQHIVRNYTWVFTPSGIVLVGTSDLDTLPSSSVFVNGLEPLPPDVPASAWMQFPTLLVGYVDMGTSTCYLSFVHPQFGKVGEWSYPCSGGWGDVRMPHVRTADTLLVDLVTYSGTDTLFRSLLEVTSNGVAETRRDTLLLQTWNVAVSSVYDPVDGDFTCVIGTDPNTGDIVAYALPLGSGSSLQQVLSPSVSSVLPRTLPTGEDDGACVFLDWNGQAFGLSVTGSSLVLQVGGSVSSPYNYFPEDFAVGGLPNGGVLWGVETSLGDTARIQAINMADLLSGGAHLVDDTLMVVGPQSGTVYLMSFRGDTLFLGTNISGQPYRVMVWDTSFAGIYDRQIGSWDTTLLGAPWILRENGTPSILSLDPATGNLRPGSYPYSGTIVSIVSKEEVEADTVFFCHRPAGDTVRAVLLDVVNFMEMPALKIYDGGTLSAPWCLWDGNYLVVVAGKSGTDSTRMVVYDRSLSGVVLDTVIGGFLAKAWLSGDVLGMDLQNTSAGTRDFLQCQIGSSLSCVGPLSKPLSYSFETFHYDGIRTYIVGFDPSLMTKVLEVLQASDFSLLESRTIHPGWVSEIASVDSLYGIIQYTGGGTKVEWFALGGSGSLAQIMIPDVNPDVTEFRVLGGGSFAWYLAGYKTMGSAQIPYVGVVAMDTATAVAEGPALSRGVRVVMRGPWLVLEGQGKVDVEVFNALGRKVMGYRGEVRGEVRMGRLPVRGVYVVRDREVGGARKVLWIGR